MISTDWAPVGLGILEQEPRIPVQAEAQAGEKRQTGFRWEIGKSVRMIYFTKKKGGTLREEKEQEKET